MPLAIYENVLLLQCPCSGGPANIFLLLAMVASVWLLAGWMKRVLKKKGDSIMNKIAKITIVIVLIAAVAVAIAIRQSKSGSQQEQFVGKGLPVLIDLGAGTCIPCKLMAPILEELKKELEGKIIVQFLDLNKNPELAQQYHISVMPTQIFYDASGKELFRHEGFYSKEDILAKWKELGVDLTEPKSQLP